MSRVFEAWALPGAVITPERQASFKAGDVEVRYPEGGRAWLDDLIGTLRDARPGLVARPVREIAQVLGSVGERFLDREDPLRVEALALMPPTTGLSEQMCEVVLDGMAADWAGDRLLELVSREFDVPGALDGFVDAGDRRVHATGPGLTVQVVSGSVPGVGTTALIRSLLVKSPTLLKLGRGDIVLPVLFARALREADAELVDASALIYWPGGTEALEERALQHAGLIIAYGGDEAVESLRSLSPVSTHFVAYHHRVSAGVVGRAALTEAEVPQAAADVAYAVSVFDQRGCVSPQVVYVEEGGETAPSEFAKQLADALAGLEETLPGGALDDDEASALHQLRGTAELMQASGSGVELHHGGEAHWTVVFDPAAAFAASCVGRSVRVKPLPGLELLPELLAAFGQHLQTVGVVGLGDREEALAQLLGHVGVSRVAPFDQVPFPPAWWHHDGGGPLRDLVRWVDLDRG